MSITELEEIEWGVDFGVIRDPLHHFAIGQLLTLSGNAIDNFLKFRGIQKIHAMDQLPLEKPAADEEGHYHC
jgi:hypothetical protein